MPEGTTARNTEKQTEAKESVVLSDTALDKVEGGDSSSSTSRDVQHGGSVGRRLHKG